MKSLEAVDRINTGSVGFGVTGIEKFVFATTNEGKLATLRQALGRAGLDKVEIDVKSPNITEPQADSCKEVAISKARQAFKELEEPVLVDDSSFHINALNGFPGVYAKYANDTLGAEGYINLMQGKKDRSAYFEGVLVFIDDQGQEHVFNQKKYHGNVADKVHDITNKTPWSELHKIFVPVGSEKVIGNITEEDRERADGHVVWGGYTLFVNWLRSQRLNT